MSGEESRGPQVPADEDAYRAILYPQWWCEAEDRPSSAAFDSPVFSVDVASRTTPQQTAARFKQVMRLVMFNCGSARELGFDTCSEADPYFPQNEAHAHVYFDAYHNHGRKGRKRLIRRLIDRCATTDL